MESDTTRLLSNDTFKNFSTISASINQSEVSESSPIVNQETDQEPGKSVNNTDFVETKVYKRRWYILFTFGIAGGTQGAFWNTWGPMAASTEEAFSWTDSDIALLSNWGMISYVTGIFFFSWIVDKYGLRAAALWMVSLLVAGAGIRCVTDKPPYVKWTMNTGQLLVGFAGILAMGLPPAVSVAWFPPKERTTATALIVVLGSIGISAPFLLGPWAVSTKPPAVNSTLTNSTVNNSIMFLESVHQNMTDKHLRIQEERKEIMRLMYYEAAFAVLVSLPIFIYFPSKPKMPPSISASQERIDFKTGFRKLAKNFQFWLVCFSYGVSLGVLGAWESVLDVNLKPHGLSESKVGWLGFYASSASVVSSLFVARFADIFTKHMKLFLLILNILAAGSFAWFTALVVGYLPHSTASLYASIILGFTLLNATPPLYFETGCELSYPVGEGFTNFILTATNNLAGLLFLLVQMIPNIGTAWENWCLVGSILICVPLLCMVKERYNRLNIDESKGNN